MIQGFTWFKTWTFTEQELLLLIGYSCLSTGYIMCGMSEGVLVAFIGCYWMFYGKNKDYDTQCLFHHLQTATRTTYYGYPYLCYQSPLYIHLLLCYPSFRYWQLIQGCCSFSILLYGYIAHDYRILYIGCTPIFMLLTLHPSADYCVMACILVYKYMYSSYLLLLCAIACKLSTLVFVFLQFPLLISIIGVFYIIIRSHFPKNSYILRVEQLLSRNCGKGWSIRKVRIEYMRRRKDFMLYGQYACYSLLWYYFPLYLLGDIDWMLPSILMIFLMRNIKYTSIFL